VSVPNDRQYLSTHEWHKVEGGVCTIGITQFAADELTDITYVSLPKIGAKVSAGQAFGEVESVKATSELFTGVSGEVTAVNEKLSESPELINDDPFEKGWMIKVKVSELSGCGKMLTAEQYEAQLKG